MQRATRAGEETHGEGVKLVTFRVGGELFGIRIEQIQEVINLCPINAIPDAPACIEGVIELRQHVIPIVDLRRLLSIGGTRGGRARILIADLAPTRLGLLVDDIAAVQVVDAACFEDLPPALAAHREDGCIKRLAKTDGAVIIELDPWRLCAKSELQQANTAARGMGDLP